jgi:hypothetical protein
MSRLLSTLTLLALLLLAAAPASGVMVRGEKTAVPDFFGSSLESAFGDEWPATPYRTRGGVDCSYETALDVRDGPNLYAYVQQNPWTKFDPDGQFWSAIITAGFAAYDTYQYASGKTSGAEYAKAMALNGAAFLADVATAGNGGGLAVRAANATIKVAKAIDKADTVYSTVNGAIRTGEAIANGDGTGAVINGVLTAVGAKQMGGGGKAPDSPKVDAPGGKSAQATNTEAQQIAANGEGPFVPDEYWTRNAPANVTPGTRRIDHTKYNKTTKQLEESRVIYDDYGRQQYRVDKTDHGRPTGNGHPNDQGHTNPHLHESTYAPKGTQGHKQETGRKEVLHNLK